MFYWASVYADCLYETCSISSFPDRLAGLVVKASTSEAAVLGSTPIFPVDLVLGQVIPVTNHWYSGGYPARRLAL